ncbi:MAG: TetR/AcrR family transcriptional regulator [Deltaproteobacteria bacterium]|nr:TetR/AcrR family transcriptional regulator [Deltaproteobacteria bacterium]
MEDNVIDRPRRRPGRPENPIPRSELVRVAREQFAAHGYDGVSMAVIARHAGLQKSSLFHHFPTKDALYRASLESVVADGMAVIAMWMADSGPWVERLDQMAMGVTRAVAAPARARLLLRELMTPAGAREAGDALQGVIDVVQQFFEDGAAAGAWPRTDFRHVTLTQFGMHLTFFALPEVSARALGVADVFAPEVVEARAREVARHVRALLGAG